MTVYNLDFVDAIHFSQSLDGGTGRLSASNRLVFSQVARCNIQYVHASNTLIFNQRAVTGGANIYVRNVAQSLPFLQKAQPRVYDRNIYQFLLFRHKLERQRGLHNQLTFVQTLTIDKSKGIHQILNFHQVATVNWTKHIPVSQTLIFKSTATCLKMDRNYIAIPITLPPAVDTTTHRTCTFICGSYILTLPSPDFDDSDRQEFTRVNKKTRGGDLIIYRDDMWPKTEVFVLKWSSLKRDELINLYNFIKNTIGKLITFTTYEDRVFVGIIRTPSSDTSEGKRQESQAQIEFEVA